MNADRVVLSTLEPRQIATWMIARGWHQEVMVEGHSALYRKPSEDGQGSFEVDLPLKSSFRDYTRRVHEVLQTLSISSGLKVTEVLTEVRASTFDIIRLRATGPQIGSGRVPVEVGTRLFAATRDLLLAAACSAHEPRAVYRTRKPTEAVEALRRIKLAPPESGSFIITVYAPVQPGLQVPLTKELDESPFVRRMTLMLAHAASSARSAAEAASLDGVGDGLLNSERDGISANFCDALADFVDGEETTGLDLRFSWAASRRPPKQAPTKVHIGADLAPVLREGARILRRTAPTPDFELHGIIRRLDSENPDDGGNVVIAGQVDDQLRRIRVSLSGEDYQKAIRAHCERLFVRCGGELRRQGGRFTLGRVQYIDVLDEAD